MLSELFAAAMQDPCSALMDPPALATNSYTKGSISANSSGDASAALMLRWMFPSPRCAKPQHVRAMPAVRALISSTSW